MNRSGLLEVGGMTGAVDDRHLALAPIASAGAPLG